MLNLNIQHLSEWCNIISHRLFLKKTFKEQKQKLIRTAKKCFHKSTNTSNTRASEIPQNISGDKTSVDKSIFVRNE